MVYSIGITKDNHYLWAGTNQGVNRIDLKKLQYDIIDITKHEPPTDIEKYYTMSVAQQIKDILDGVEKLCGEPNMRFRYFKSFKSQDATLENLELAIPPLNPGMLIVII